MKIVAAHFRSRELAAWQFSNGTVTPTAVSVPSPGNSVYGPGWTDLQCNGYAGVDFNHPETTAEEVGGAIRQMWAAGCTTVLPTVITHSPERMEHQLRILVRARRLDARVAESIPGFHLEGPFISPVDGARGAHPAEHVRPPDAAVWERCQRAADGLIRLVTLAPETSGALEFIARLRREGVIPALGHTMASAAEIADAVAAGALISTHLGNGCPQYLHRHESSILSQLAHDELRATFIPDGIHLPHSVLRTFVRAKTPARCLIVTDAMAAAGAPAGEYTLGDLRLTVGEDGAVRQLGSPNFAGSALTMADAVTRFSAATRLPLSSAWRAASHRPAALLRHRSRATIIARVVDGALKPQAAMRGNEILWIAGAV